MKRSEKEQINNEIATGGYSLAACEHRNIPLKGASRPLPTHDLPSGRQRRIVGREGGRARALTYSTDNEMKYERSVAVG